MSWSTLSFSDEVLQNSKELSSPPINLEDNPPIFSSGYFGLTLNQNQPMSSGLETWSSGGPSYGGEYRYFYKDRWSLAASGAFKQLYGRDDASLPLLFVSQQTLKILRVYHPLYLGLGWRVSYIMPVRKIELPYERDQTRLIDTGGSLDFSIFFLTKNNFLIMTSVQRWRSFSTTKRQGIEISVSALAAFR